MAVASVADVLLAIRTRLTTHAYATQRGFAEGSVFIVDRLRFIEPPIADRFIQIASLGGSFPHGRSGVSLWTGRVAVGVFARVITDAMPYDQADLLTGTNSCVEIMDALNEVLIHSFLQGALVVPLVATQDSTLETSPDIPNGWAFSAVTYDYSIERQVSRINVLNDSSTPDLGQTVGDCPNAGH